jgi:hypothetical protein
VRARMCVFDFVSMIRIDDKLRRRFKCRSTVLSWSAINNVIGVQDTEPVKEEKKKQKIKNKRIPENRRERTERKRNNGDGRIEI